MDFGITNFGITVDFGITDFGITDFRIMVDFVVTDFGIMDFGITDFGITDFFIFFLFFDLPHCTCNPNTLKKDDVNLLCTTDPYLMARTVYLLLVYYLVVKYRQW